MDADPSERNKHVVGTKINGSSSGELSPVKIESLLIKGFRCFSHEGQVVVLNNLTCLVGPNASGKTATMAALARMFGENQSDRTIKPSDFHLSPGETLDSKKERCLMVEAKLVFPGLDADSHHVPGVPEVYNQMVVDETGQAPYCRVRLDAVWTNDDTPLGDVQQKLSWVSTSSDDPEKIEKRRQRMEPTDRARIRVIYVPAARDPLVQIRTTSATVFGRLVRALEWGGKDAEVKLRLQELKKSLDQLPGIGTMGTMVEAVWQSLYDGRVAANLTFQSVEPDPHALVDLLAPVFAPDEQGHSLRTSDLSDGLRTLFSLSLPVGLYRLEEAIRADLTGLGFQASVLEHMPILTIFAVEEPENHLAPHYLGKVVRELSQVSKFPNAQVLISSHSPCIMSRIEPDDVRYFLGGENHVCSSVKPLPLPTEESDEAYKYVREAVKGFPELYFSRLAILGEGPSEEIILRKLFEESGTPLDAHFISIVPLGGRHVNHFWRLLKGLGIPHITLLDLDRERDGGDWGRVQYIRDQLVKLHGETSPMLSFKDVTGANRSLAEADFLTLSANTIRSHPGQLEKWLEFLQVQHLVYFSQPLDLDFALLAAFPDVYRAQAPSGGGPRVPDAEPQRSESAQSRMRQTLSSAEPSKMPATLGSSYTAEQALLFPWYRYLFIDGSKPVSHLRALLSLTGTDWLGRLPQTLRLILDRARECVTVKPTS